MSFIVIIVYIVQNGIDDFIYGSLIVCLVLILRLMNNYDVNFLY